MDTAVGDNLMANARGDIPNGPRVLMLGWEFPPTILGGLGTACYHLVAQLRSIGVPIVLTLPHQPKQPLPIKGVDYKLVSTEDSPTSGATPSTYSAIYDDHTRTRVAKYADSVETLAATIEFDVIHAHDWMTWPAALRAKSVSGRPLVTHVHSTEFDRSADMPSSDIIECERQGLHAADAVVAVSRMNAAILVKRYNLPPRRIVVVHNGPGNLIGNEFAASPPDDDQILFAGRMVAQKNPLVFVTAAERIAREFTRARFVMAGDGEMLDAVANAVDCVGLTSRFQLTGFVSPRSLAALYQSSAIYVMPSRHDPFGMSALEAAGAGAATIVTAACGVTEVLPSSLVIPAATPTTIASAVGALLRNPSYRQQLAAKQQQEARSTTWCRAAHELAFVYRCATATGSQ